MHLNQNLLKIHNDIQTHSPHPGRVQLIAVTKNRSASEIDQLIKSGVSIIGENRIQSAQLKFPRLKNPVKKHFIGHLQSNKANLAVELFDCIESVDSLKIAKMINKIAQEKQINLPILLQINISGDPAKFGFKTDEIKKNLPELSKLNNLDIQGLMTIGQQHKDPHKTYTDFKNLKNLLEDINKQNILSTKLTELSMGMSDDYQIALKCGSTMIRIGRKLFE